jgi:hypothetical protein
MKKELIVFIATNEEGEAIRVSRVDDGSNRFMLLTLGVNRMVVDVAELMDGIGAIGHYSTLFDQEELMKAMRAKTQSSPQPPVTTVKHASKEEEIVFDVAMSSGPSASELALEAQTKHMQGGTLVLKEE